MRNWLIQLKTRITPDHEIVEESFHEHVEHQEEEQLEEDLHAAEVILRRVHANLGHPSKGRMLRLFRDADAPPEMIAVARFFIVPTVI